ncbi:MAG TPA: hydrogenase maturation nickel metallochaperone HypA [Steroidobacteraceae bacterium]|nr:hydrogenase maturation nickel metallochaperone HypA [Steroidobacteraceae bacterium]
MHELAICRELVDQVAAIAAEQHAVRVVTIVVRIGPLSGVEGGLLERAYPLASTGTVAEGATLVLESQPITVRCSACGQESGAAANRLLCGHCGDWRTQVVSGDELLLATVELERAGTAAPVH